MKEYMQYRLPQNASDQIMVAIIAEDYALEAERPVAGVMTFYDTFDWRLYNKSLALCFTGDELLVRRLPAGIVVETMPSESSPEFAQQLGHSRLKRRIAPILQDRRLFGIGRASVHTLPFRVLDANDEIVARIVSVEVRAADDSGGDLLDAYIALLAVPGQRKHVQRLTRRCQAAGLIPSRWHETFERIVATAGKQPGNYSARPNYRLQSGMPADAAMKEILRRTLEVMRANEEGIKADWDVEFLHDYRTAVRRTRSALSQVPGVFLPETTQRYKEAFAQLGRRSNQLRDLDVYLAAESAYCAMFPEAMRDHIAPLFDYLRAQREIAWPELVDYLNSMPYAALMEAWDAFLHEPVADSPAAPNAAIAIDELARRRIFKQYRQVIKDGRRILDSDEDEWVHQLRIDCKKLRYSMEFFASLFPKKEIARLISQLKILQDDLGVFNDLSVQQAYLLHIAEVLPASSVQEKKVLMAIGFLVEKLYSEQQAIKAGLAHAFSEFSAAPNSALFRQLFRARARASEP